MTAAADGAAGDGAAGEGAARDAGRRLVDEALRLVEALRDADGVRDRAADAASVLLGVGTDGPGTAHTGPECRACPVCRVIAAVRTLRPEAVEHLALAAAELANAWREVVAGAQDVTPPPPTPREEPCVEPIVVTD